MFTLIATACLLQFFGQPGAALSPIPPHNLTISGLRLPGDTGWRSDWAGPDPSTRIRFTSGYLVHDRYTMRLDNDDQPVWVHSQARVPLSGLSLETRTRVAFIRYPAAPNPYPVESGRGDWSPWQDMGPPARIRRAWDEETGQSYPVATWVNTPFGHIEAANDDP